MSKLKEYVKENLFKEKGSIGLGGQPIKLFGHILGSMTITNNSITYFDKKGKEVATLSGFKNKKVAGDFSSDLLSTQIGDKTDGSSVVADTFADSIIKRDKIKLKMAQKRIKVKDTDLVLPNMD